MTSIARFPGRVGLTLTVLLALFLLAVTGAPARSPTGSPGGAIEPDGVATSAQGPGPAEPGEELAARSGAESAARAAGEETAAAGGPVAVPEPSEKARRYFRSGTVLWAVSLLWGVLLPAAILWSGLSGRLRDAARAIGRWWYPVIVLYFVFFSLLTFVLDLPLAWYEGYARPHAYDLSNQELGTWLGDAVKGLFVGLIAGALLLWIPYLLLLKSPRRWWLYTGLVTVPILFLGMLVTPIWVAPLFNDFGPMEDTALEARILALAERAGIEGSRVFEVDMSDDTETVNAYVSGFGATKRIVLWDTIIEKLDEDELLFVMGHEMGHYALGHVVKTILFLSAMILGGLLFIHLVSGALLARFGKRFGFTELSDVASLPLILLLFNVYFFAASPVILAHSRHLEHESDRFGLELTRDNRAAAMAFVKLQQENLGVPRPGALYKLWRASHPLLGERIDFCNAYRPWETGEPLAYGDIFEAPPGGTR